MCEELFILELLLKNVDGELLLSLMLLELKWCGLREGVWSELLNVLSLGIAE